MWKNALFGTAMANFEGIDYFREMRLSRHDLRADICMFVVDGFNALPWYLKQPLKLYVFFVNLLCLAFTGHMFANIQPEERQKIMQKLKKIPFFRMYNKFVRARVFLKLFDVVS